jgi:flavorubredoxin
MGIEIYNENKHICVCFNNLVEGEGIQSNQFLVLDDDHSALIDPGGNLTFSRLYIHAGRYTTVKKLDYVIASHQDPDIVASVNKWLEGTSCKVVISKVWERFLPHFCTPGNYTSDRLITIPDSGADIPLGRISLKAIPAHFLHSVGNFHFYDPVAKILFSGDVGASVDGGDVSEAVTDFDAHIPHMLPFHQRYMVSNAACRYWVNMVRNLDLEWIIPQHGAPFRGEQVIDQFLSWFETLPCGIDLFSQRDYEIP